jgi:hypothetical protein
MATADATVSSSLQAASRFAGCLKRDVELQD